MLPASSNDAVGSAVPRTRRFHNKSRTGCRGCKVRRIKCDEGRPICSNCIRRSAECEYDTPLEEAQSMQAEPTTSTSTTNAPQERVAKRPRKSRSQKAPAAPVRFTFVEVNSLLARTGKNPETEPVAEPIQPAEMASPAPSDATEMIVSAMPILAEAVDEALEKGHRIAEMMLVSRQSPLLLVGNEYIPSQSAAQNLSSSIGLYTGARGTGTGMSEGTSSRPHQSNMSISRWQSSPSTGLAQADTPINISLQDYNLVNTYRRLTCKTFPYVAGKRNPWKALTFDLQFRHPYLFHTTLAVTGAHIRYLQGVDTPALLEISHYIKGLASYRESIATQEPYPTTITKVIDSPIVSQGLFATSALLGGYLWASEVSDIHSWLIAKFSMSVGTREIIRGAWDAQLFSEFKEAIGDTLQGVTEKIQGVIHVGRHRIPALEALATGQPIAELLLPDAAQNQEGKDAFASTDKDNVNPLGPEIYEKKYGWVDHQDCPFYKNSKGTMVTDIGTLHRLACLVTALQKQESISLATMKAGMSLIHMWPGISCHIILEKLKVRDKRVYLMLAYYFATIVKMKQLQMPTLASLWNEDEWDPSQEEAAKSWWLMKNPRLLLRGIIDWLGKDWVQWLDWPLEILAQEEDFERRRIQGLWEPAMADMNFTV